MRLTSVPLMQRLLDETHTNQYCLTSTNAEAYQRSQQGVVHCRFDRCGATALTPASLTFAEVVTSELCKDCTPSILNTAVGHRVLPLLSAAQAAQAARRAVERGADLSKHVNTLEREWRKATQAASPVPELDAARAHVLRLCDQARTQVEDALTGPGYRIGVLEMVRCNLVPRGATHMAILDETDCLIGLSSPMVGSGDAQKVLLTLVVRHAGKQQVLRGPRFVVDYLYREQYRTSESPVMACAPTDGVDDQTLEVAASLWDPTSATLASVAAAVAAAKAVTA